MSQKRLFQYKFRMKHDNGNTKITVVAINLAFAMQRVLNSECAPESAITKIKIKEL